MIHILIHICAGNALLRRLVRIGVLDETRMKLDYVLGLKIEDFLERRLQTQVSARNCLQRMLDTYNFALSLVSSFIMPQCFYGYHISCCRSVEIVSDILTEFCSV